MSKLKFILSVSFLLCLCSSLGTVRHTEAQAATSVTDLWLDVSLGPPLVSWFNQVARPEDIARVESTANLRLLEEVTVGRKLVVFKSVAAAEEMVPAIADQIDIVGYNLEQGPANPVNEQNDPVAGAQRMRDLADEYGLLLAFGPDHFFAVNNGVAIAPFVDIFVLQVQRVQTDHRTVREFVLPLAPQLRRANPDLQISVQVRTEGDVEALVDLVDSMKDELSGVSILTSPETVPVARSLVDALRRRDSSPTPRPPASSPARDPTGGFSWLPTILIMVIVLVIVSGLVSAPILMRQRGRDSAVSDWDFDDYG